MIINILYLVMGMIVGILIKYEIDIRAKKKRLEKRATYLKATADDSKMKQYDDILYSIRSINESLSSVQRQQQKEVQ
jgi:uncharacterized membrane protein YqgA involved in biofilm formation